MVREERRIIMIYTLIGKQALFPAVADAMADEDGVLMETRLEWSHTPIYVSEDASKMLEIKKFIARECGKETFIVAFRDAYEYEVFIKMSVVLYEAYCRKYDNRAKKSKAISIYVPYNESLYPYMKAMSFYPWTKRNDKRRKGEGTTLVFNFGSDASLLKLLEDIKTHGCIRSDEEIYGI